MMKNNNAHYIFNGYQGTSSVMFRVEFRFNKKYEIRVALVNDKAVWKNSKWIAISDAVHFFELDWSAATAVEANNGYLKLWVDGVLKQKSKMYGSFFLLLTIKLLGTIEYEFSKKINCVFWLLFDLNIDFGSK